MLMNLNEIFARAKSKRIEDMSRPERREQMRRALQSRDYAERIIKSMTTGRLMTKDF